MVQKKELSRNILSFEKDLKILLLRLVDLVDLAE